MLMVLLFLRAQQVSDLGARMMRFLLDLSNICSVQLALIIRIRWKIIVAFELTSQFLLRVPRVHGLLVHCR